MGGGRMRVPEVDWTIALGRDGALDLVKVYGAVEFCMERMGKRKSILTGKSIRYVKVEPDATCMFTTSVESLRCRGSPTYSLKRKRRRIGGIYTFASATTGMRMQL